MRLRDFVGPDLVHLGVRAGDAREVVREITSRVAALGIVEDPDRLAEALLAREAMHTTAMGNGVAIPHATVAGLREPLILVLVAPEGAAFGPVGLEPVRVFFVLLSPPGQAGLHIKLLARIARLVRHPGFIERLECAPSTAALLEEIERVDAAHV